ncbi:MAG TPA: peptidylprolyl isomerase, partial [Gemmataceae bacterium]|nr:peptidylprolyl isomerase [Gemmataceae bacterium]
DAALIEFFRSRTLEEDARDKVAALVRDLGADDFQVRERASKELVTLGKKAAPLLRQAKDSRDAEVARRAKACLEKIEQKQEPTLIIAAARLLAARRPATAAQTLLDFAPFADDRDVLESVRDALAALAVRDGKPEPVLANALVSKQPLSRGLAGEALVRAGQADAVPAVRELLDDADRLVRMRVGLAFVDKNDKSVVPRLIELLADLPRDQSQGIEDLLGRIALEKSPDIPPGDDPATRKKCRDAWSEWWTKNGKEVDLTQISRKLVVAVETSKGTIKIELYADKAPITVKNFLRYVKDKHYNGLIFHRVIPNFMIQGGGMEPGLKERKARDPIKNESSNGLSNKRGTVATARAPDPDSATSQFFINVKDNAFLDKAKLRDGAGYCVFGRVVEGMDVVDKIKDVATRTLGGHRDVPVEDVVIKSVRVVR